MTDRQAIVLLVLSYVLEVAAYGTLLAVIACIAYQILSAWQVV